MAEQQFTVEPSSAGQRLDKLIVARVSGLGRKAARWLFDEGRVRVNGHKASKGDLAREGDTITVVLEDTPTEGTVAQVELPLIVRYETSELVVVEKPAGQPTAPLRAGETGTLANALVARYPEMQGIGHAPREPGLVHRLDTDTSGLILAARSARAFDVLSRGLKAGAIDKAYALVCEGSELADTGTIVIPLAHHPKDRRRMYACVHPRDVQRYDPRPATTSFEVLERQGRWALVEARAKSAVRHQIRAHLAATGHPLANDALYGGVPVPDLTGHALHASRITWQGGEDVPAFEVVSPVPEAWQVFFGVGVLAGSS